MPQRKSARAPGPSAAPWSRPSACRPAWGRRSAPVPSAATSAAGYKGRRRASRHIREKRQWSGAWLLAPFPTLCQGTRAPRSHPAFEESPGVLSTRAAEDGSVAGESAQVPDQEEVLEVADGRGQALQALQ